ncbi:hypothetical protein [Sulfitobacter alexandrii]|nr:hypothetical protein [Sulfitobacter alexandrii]
MRLTVPVLLAALSGLPLATAGLAESSSLFVPGIWGGAAAGLISVRAPDHTDGGSSLFAGRAPRGLFAQPPVAPPGKPRAAPMTAGSDVQIIRALIEEAESRRDGYDAVQHGARIRPPRRPTQMSLAEIYQWIEETPGQPHAIGRYQFIPATLRRVAGKLGVAPRARFSAGLQDRLADVLLAEAGLQSFREGELGRVDFMNNLAKIWAGLPNASGRSHYHGHAGNRASITWERFEAEMRRIDPAVALAQAGTAPSP